MRKRRVDKRQEVFNFKLKDSSWKSEWKDMPEFVQEDTNSYRRIVVHFKNQRDVDRFAELINQKITPKQKSLWYPPTEIRRYSDKRYVDESDERFADES